MKLAPYTESERALHEKMKSLRNTVYAHSDMELREVRPINFNGRATAVVRLPSLKLTRAETGRSLLMIAKTSKAIDEKLQDLIAQVSPSEIVDILREMKVGDRVSVTEPHPK